MPGRRRSACSPGESKEEAISWHRVTHRHIHLVRGKAEVGICFPRFYGTPVVWLSRGPGYLREKVAWPESGCTKAWLEEMLPEES